MHAGECVSIVNIYWKMARTLNNLHSTLQKWNATNKMKLNEILNSQSVQSHTESMIMQEIYVCSEYKS